MFIYSRLDEALRSHADEDLHELTPKLASSLNVKNMDDKCTRRLDQSLKNKQEYYIGNTFFNTCKLVMFFQPVMSTIYNL